MREFLYSLFKKQNEILEKINDNIEHLREPITNKDEKITYDNWIFLPTDENGHSKPPENDYDGYEYVLVKLNDRTGHTLSVPRVARYVPNRNLWFSPDHDKVYGKGYECEVVMWKPIPGTEWDDICVDGKNIERIYSYR